MDEVLVQVGDKGRILIPAAYRKALGVNVGDELVLTMEGNELRAISRMEALRRLQDEIERYIPGDRLLSEDLLAERRAEAARE